MRFRTALLLIFALMCAAAGAWVALVYSSPTVREAGGVATSSEPPPAGALLAVPVKDMPRSEIKDSWGDPRENGKRAHHGTDIMAPNGQPVIAAAPGAIEKLFQSEKGGITLYVRSPQRQWTYYYAHLSSYAPGLHVGQTVQTGDTLAYVGDTGDAGPGNYHLHFGLTKTQPSDGWWQGTDVNPYPYLTGLPGH